MAVCHTSQLFMLLNYWAPCTAAKASSLFMRISLGLLPTLGPTIPSSSMASISRAALVYPTRKRR